MNKFLILSVASMALFALPAQAEEGAKPDGMHHRGNGEHMMKTLDTDADGAVSKEEFMKESEKRFGEIDANGDGKITQDEFQARMAEKRKMYEAKRAEKEKALEEGKPEGAAPAAVPAETQPAEVPPVKGTE